METSRETVVEDELAEHAISLENFLKRQVYWEHDTFKNWFHGIEKKDGRSEQREKWRKSKLREVELETAEGS